MPRDRPRALRRRPPGLRRARCAAPSTPCADLFVGATWFLTPVADTDTRRYRDLHAFVASLGAEPVAIDPGAHDRLLALTSHLPHVIANLLVNQAGAGRIDGHDPLAAGGGSFRDMTRVAGANPRIWVDIFLDNREALAAAIREHRRLSDEVLAALERGDAGFLARWIAQAGGHRRRALEAAYERRPEEMVQIDAHVPDQPGVISGITQALGAARINIEDFELHHFTPDRGGTISIVVAGHAAADETVAILDAQGYSAIADAARRRRRRVTRRRRPARRARERARRRDLAARRQVGLAPRGALRARSPTAPWRSTGFGAGADTLSTIAAVEQLGARVELLDDGPTRLRVHGVGLRGLRAPDGPIDVGNAGTLLRLLRRASSRGRTGRSRSTATSRSAAGPSIAWRSRCARWARRSSTRDGCPPLQVVGGAALQPISYTLPVASAQVKSASCWPACTRATARPSWSSRSRRATTPSACCGMPACGSSGKRGEISVLAGRAARARPRRRCPSDPSSAAPFLVAATLLLESRLFLRGDLDEPGAHRHPHRARAHGRPHHRLQPADAARGRAGRRPRGAALRARRVRDRARARARRWSTSSR